MAVSSTPYSPDVSVGNGATNTFPYSFRVLAAQHVVVEVDGVALSYPADYYVTGVGDESGGSVVTTVPPAYQAEVVRRRVTTIERTTEYQNMGDLLSTTHNADHDAPVLMLQELKEAFDRSLYTPPGAEDGATQFNGRGNKLQSIADGVESSDAATVAQVAAAATSAAPFLQSGTGAEARTVLDKLREIEVSATDYGASASATAEVNTLAIQKAIDYAETLVEAITSNYDVITASVTLPAGRFAHDGLLLAATVDGVQLVGKGAGATVLEYSGSGVGIDVGTESGSPNFSHVWLRDLTLRGGNPAMTGDSGDIVAGSTGIRFNRMIRNCGMERCQVFGFETNVVLRDCWTFKIRDSHFHDASLSHIVWQTALNGEITGCRFDDSGATAVVIDGQGTSNQVRDFRVVGNAFQESEVGALRMIDVSNAWIESNHFENNNQSDAGDHSEIEFIQGTSARVDGTLTLASNYYSPGASTFTGTERCVKVDAARHVQCYGEKVGSSSYNHYLRADSEVQHVELVGGVFTNMSGDPVSRESTNTTIREAWTRVDTDGVVVETVNRHTVGTREIDIGRFWNGGVTTSTGSVTTAAGNVFYNVAGNNQSLELKTADLKNGNAVRVWKYSTSGTLSVVTEGAEQIELNGSSNNQVQLAAQRGAAWFVGNADATAWVCMPGDAGATWALAA